MKKLILFFLIIGLAFSLAVCNTQADDTSKDKDKDKQGSEEDGKEGDEEESEKDGEEGEDTDWTVDYLYKVANAGDYPGAEVDLSDRELSDISAYQSVTVNATLYTDEDGTVKAVTPTGDKNNLAQFKLLKATGGWDDASNICGPTKYNMVVDGDTTWNVTKDASGVPAILLLQANWVDFTADGVKVKSIKVNSITFTAKTGEPVLELDVVYGDNYVSVAGNKITFKNAEYKDGAAILKFPESFPATLTGKQLVIKFTIEDHTCTDEHQIHIQAANSDKNSFNGRNPPDHGGVGQKYITLDSESETGWAENSGTIKVKLDDLIAAAAVSADANDCKGPFTLDAIRICNNGTVWEGHVRCKSYTLVIESVKVE